MCVAIIVQADGKVPSKERLQLCADANKHGAGVAWLEKGQVKWSKGWTTADDIKNLLDFVQRLKPPMMIHFRIATAGGAVQALTHPFPINKDASTELVGKASAVMMHNGHLSQWTDKLLRHIPRGVKIPPGPWSDTRAMAWLAYHLGPEVFTFLDEKVAYMDHTGNINWWGNWHEKDGAIYSNLIWEPFKFQSYVGGHSTAYMYDKEKQLAEAREKGKADKAAKRAAWEAKKAERSKEIQDCNSPVCKQAEPGQLALVGAKEAAPTTAESFLDASFHDVQQALGEQVRNESDKRALLEMELGSKVSDEDWEDFYKDVVDFTIHPASPNSDLVIVNGGVTKRTL